MIYEVKGKTFSQNNKKKETKRTLIRRINISFGEILLKISFVKLFIFINITFLNLWYKIYYTGFMNKYFIKYSMAKKYNSEFFQV